MGGARGTALRTLVAREKQGAWSEGYLKNAIRADGLEPRDAALATRLCAGVLQNQTRLDWYLGRLSHVRLAKLEAPVLCALRLGLFQLLELDRVPACAAVDESVKLARKYAKNPRAAGMVNAILRNFLRQREELGEPAGGSWSETMSLRYSHPQWLVEEFCARVGREETEQLLMLNNREPPTVAQVNTLQASAEDVVESLAAQGVQAERHPWLAGCLLLRGTGDIEKLDVWQKGLLYIQDAAAKLAAWCAGAKPGERVLDACAAPGGKSFALGIRMRGQGEIVSCDIHPHKLKLIEAGRDRLGLPLIRAELQDGAQFRPEWAENFDVVLVDAPCSGFGIIRKKPDIRYKKAEPLAGLPAVQFRILANNARYVKSGGVLLYATCTLLERENEKIVERFLTERRDFRMEPAEIPGFGPLGDQTTLWPQRDGTDGFFIARMRRER